MVLMVTHNSIPKTLNGKAEENVKNEKQDSDKLGKQKYEGKAKRRTSVRYSNLPDVRAENFVGVEIRAFQ